jgi:phosphotransferase system  glucose/maltose/N-acetylglucosamine-specific IIC component
MGCKPRDSSSVRMSLRVAESRSKTAVSSNSWYVLERRAESQRLRNNDCETVKTERISSYGLLMSSRKQMALLLLLIINAIAFSLQSKSLAFFSRARQNLNIITSLSVVIMTLLLLLWLLVESVVSQGSENVGVTTVEDGGRNERVPTARRASVIAAAFG